MDGARVFQMCRARASGSVERAPNLQARSRSDWREFCHNWGKTHDKGRSQVEAHVLPGTASKSTSARTPRSTALTISIHPSSSSTHIYSSELTSDDMQTGQLFVPNGYISSQETQSAPPLFFRNFQRDSLFSS